MGSFSPSGRCRSRKLFALVIRQARAPAGLALVVVTRSASAAFAFVQFRPACVYLGVESSVTPSVCAAVVVFLAYATAFRPVDGAALAFLARVIEIARPAHGHRRRRVAVAEVAL